MKALSYLGGDFVSWRRLRDLTNMRREDFDRCKKYLDNYTDNATADKIRGII